LSKETFAEVGGSRTLKRGDLDLAVFGRHVEETGGIALLPLAECPRVNSSESYPGGNVWNFGSFAISWRCGASVI
jgi:hypothetical protein